MGVFGCKEGFRVTKVNFPYMAIRKIFESKFQWVINTKEFDIKLYTAHCYFSKSIKTNVSSDCEWKKKNLILIHIHIHNTMNSQLNGRMQRIVSYRLNNTLLSCFQY